MTSSLEQELATRAPARARPYARTIAATATARWPSNPRFFAWLTIGVGERETGWRNVRGADGHGCGLLQIDDRAWKTWCQGHNAFDPDQNIPEGEYILSLGLKWFPKDLRAAIACYNCGPGNVRKGLALDPPNPDAFTTGGDYSAWVLTRLNKIRPMDLLLVP